MDQEKITGAILAIFNGSDEHSWTKVQRAMAEKVLLDYASLSGSPATTLSSKQIIDTWKGFLPGFDKTHHQLSNLQISQNEHHASVHCNGKADHFIGAEVWTVEGTYDIELSKIGGQWLVTQLKFNLSKQSGNTNLPADAAARVKNESNKQ